MRIRFTEAVIYETKGPLDGETFEMGQVEDLRDDIAQRWLRRGVAEPCPEEIQKPARRATKGGNDA